MKREKMEVTIQGKKLVFETGKVARQAGGAVFLHAGETTVFSTACASKTPLEDVDFLPLRVDYQEKFSSAGKTLGGWIKREGRPTQRETIVCRMIDRPARPMFPEGYYHDTQVIAYVYSYDGVNRPDVLAICAASAALVLSEIPIKCPIGAVRVGRVNGAFIINPDEDQLKQSTLDLVLAGTEKAILMTEGYCDFLSEEELLEAVDVGHEAIRTICCALSEWQTKLGKEKRTDSLKALSQEAQEEVYKMAHHLLQESLQIADKQEREAALAKIEETVMSSLTSEEPARFTPREIKSALKKLSAKCMRESVLNTHTRIDGRKLDEIRPIDIEHGLLPRVHGSALFTRGETQALAVCTLGGETMAQRFENLQGEDVQRFYLQYSFPPFSVGEVGRMGPVSRREMGHGKLAERALMSTLPSKEDFPYVIRLESNITESNGSSSMASVCGGCIALMDAGVPITRPTAGIAMGLILEGDRVAILSDILGAEDALGDMDFKVTGDEKGVTAFQMDIKVEGITREIMQKALKQAKEGRTYILEEMLQTLPKSKESLSKHAPRIEHIQIKPSKIGVVIGPGGKQIRAIIEETGVEIDIDDAGIVSIASNDNESMEKAKAIIHGLTAEVEVEAIYSGKIVSIVAFGLFVEILPGKEGLCHISEISHSRVENLQDLYKEGDSLEVKVLEINDRGQIRLSHKALLPKKEKEKVRKA
ncbi:MAG: polyribonucleotide nucleotidyltransferase [Chlamydiota bacterium]